MLLKIRMRYVHDQHHSEWARLCTTIMPSASAACPWAIKPDFVLEAVIKDHCFTLLPPHAFSTAVLPDPHHTAALRPDKHGQMHPQPGGCWAAVGTDVRVWS